MIGQISIAALVAVLALIAEHYFPWQLVLRRELPRPAAYILGVLALILPLTSLYLVWANYPPDYRYAHCVALWAVVISGGLAVIFAYMLDWVISKLTLAFELKELVELYEEKLNESGEAEE